MTRRPTVRYRVRCGWRSRTCEAWVDDVPNVMVLDPLAAAAWLNDRPARMHGKLVWPGRAMHERVEAL